MSQEQSRPRNRRSGVTRIIIVIILVLLLLLLCWFLRPTIEGFFVTGEATPDQVAVEPTVEATVETPVVEETEEIVATEEAMPVTVPTINLPEGVVPAGEVTLNGTGEPNATVGIVVNGQPVGNTPVNSDGNWTFTTDLPEPGEYEIRARAIGRDGAVLAESEPAILSVTAAEPEEVTPTVNLPGGEVPAGEVSISGTGEPNSAVEIVVDGRAIGITSVNSDGNWTSTVNLPEPGEYEIRARAVGEEGTVLAESEPVTLTVVVAEPAPEQEGFSLTQGDVYVVQRDDWLSKLADRYYGDMFAYPVIVEATNAKAVQDESFDVITNPDLIEIGQKLWIPDEDTVSFEN